MSVAVVPAVQAQASLPSTRELSRRRAISRFRWSILGPLIALLVFVLMPVLFLQLYFSLHQWTVYLGTWWDAEYVGLELFQEVLTDPRFGWAVVRSLSFATGSTIGCFLIGFALAYLMYEPFRGQAFYYIIFILPMLTVPVVVAYTAEMMLYQSGPLNDLITRIIGINSSLRGSQSPYRAADRDAAGDLELGAVLFHHHAGGLVGHSKGRSRRRRSSAPRNGVFSGRYNSAAAAVISWRWCSLPGSDGRVS